MNKKIKWIALGVLSAALVGCTVTACASPDKEGFFPPYENGSDQDKVYSDKNATVDGEFSDNEIWKNANWHSMQSTSENRNNVNDFVELPDAQIKATTVVTQEGIYVGVLSDEKVLYVGEDWNDKPDSDVKHLSFAKTGITMYFTDVRNRFRAGRFSYELGLAVDGSYDLRYSGDSQSYKRVNSKTIYTGVKCNGELNSVNANGFSIEAFIPWESVPGVDLNDKPFSLSATFASHRFDHATPSENTLVWEMLDNRYGQSWMTTAAWSEYGANGEVLQAEGSVFGRYKNFVYDAGYDVSGDKEGADRKVEYKPDYQDVRQARLYARDVKDTELYVEARFKIGDVSSSPDRYPMLGFSFHGDPTKSGGETKSCVFHAGVTLDVKQENNPFNCTFTAAPVNGGDFVGVRSFNTRDPFDPTAEEGFKMSVYRKGADFYIYYNDILYDKKSVPFIGADTETFVGVFVINCPVTLTEYTVCAGEEAAKLGGPTAAEYDPSDYAIDGVAEEKWSEYEGATAQLKGEDASGKSFTAKAVLGSNGLYILAEIRHEYYFDNQNAKWGEWANQFNTPGVEGITHLTVALADRANNSNCNLYFTVSQYGVRAMNGKTGTNVIGTMKTTDSGNEGSKTRYTSVAECFIPAPVLNRGNAYLNEDKNSVNLELLFVSYNGNQKDELQTPTNYISNTANGNAYAWTWTWPLANPVNGQLNSWARGRWLTVTEQGIEKQPEVNVQINGKDASQDNSATVTIDNTGDYFWDKEYEFTINVDDDYLLTEVKVNGIKVVAENGRYTFTYRGETAISVVTAKRGYASVVAPNDIVTVTVNGNEDLSKLYQGGEQVTFTVTLNNGYADGYYAVTSVKVNGVNLTASSEGTYTKEYLKSEGVFAITVEAGLVCGDAEITVTARDIAAEKGKTAGIVLTFIPQSGDSFTATADGNGKITLTQKPLATYTVRGRMFGGELKFANVVLTERNNSATITHSGTYINYGKDNTAVLDYGTSSISFGTGGNTVLFGSQNLSEVWFTMKITFANRSDYKNFRFLLPNSKTDWSNGSLPNTDFVEFLHNNHGFIKNDAKNEMTINSEQIGSAMDSGTCYVMYARTADGKIKMAWANTADGLTSAQVKEFTAKSGTTAIDQIGFTTGALTEGDGVKYLSSGATLADALKEMKAYEEKDNA